MIVNLTTLFMIIALLQVSAEGFGQISINKKDASLENIFRSIEDQTDYVFFSKDYDLTKGDIDIHVKDASLETVLNTCFRNLPLSYKVVDRTVVIRKIEKGTEEKVDIAFQEISSRGRVVDSNGGPLTGVSVKLKGTTIGATTNTEGRYTITVPD